VSLRLHSKPVHRLKKTLHILSECNANFFTSTASNCAIIRLCLKWFEPRSEPNTFHTEISKENAMKKLIRNRAWLAGPLALGLTVGSLAIVQSQPDMNDAPKGDNPPARGGRGNQAGNRADVRNMTPEQREQLMQQRQQEMQQRRAENLRRQLQNAGYTDQALQNAVIEFANSQEQAQNGLQNKIRALSEAIRGGATDNDVAALLADARATAQALESQRAAALKALDARVGYSSKPKLDALLALMGLTGDELAAGGGRGGFGGPGMAGQAFGGGGPQGAGAPRQPRQPRQQGQQQGQRGQGGRNGGGFGGGPAGPEA
jgi:hypothetical protein